MLSVGADPVVVEHQLRSGGLTCPQCGQPLAPWGHAALRFVRPTAAMVERIRPRRAICSSPAGCGRSHVLLPRFCLGRRVDAVAVIWPTLLARAAGWGWRRICAAVRRAAGPAVFEVSSAELVAACSGGWLLATRPPAVAALSINTGRRL